MWFEQWNQPLPSWQWGVVIGASLLAAVWDLALRRVPNALTVPLFLAGLAWAAVHAGWAGLGDAAAAAVLLALPYVLLFAFAGGGAGDAKLMGAVGAWLGLANGLTALAAVAAAGIVFAVVFAAAKKQLTAALGRVGSAALALACNVAGKRVAGDGEGPAEAPDREKMPYGLAVLAGVSAAAAANLLWSR